MSKELGITIRLVVSHQDNPSEKIWFGSVEKTARAHDIPVITPENPNVPEVVDRIARAEPDFIFSFYYRNMLSTEILGIPKMGAFNVHGSWVEDNAMMMHKRHDRFCQAFQHPGNRFHLAASGGFFAWVKHPWPELNSRQAASKVLDEADTICLPGAAFGPNLESYLRLSFGNIREEEIPEAIDRMVGLGN